MSLPLARILQETPPDKAARLLAGVTRSVLPDPGIGSAPHDAVDVGLQAEVTRKLLAHFRIPDFDPGHPTPENPRQVARMYKALADAMASQALPRSRVAAAKARLGEKGLLPPSDFRIAFSEQFDQARDDSAVSRSSALKAITKPDQHEHFVPQSYGVDEADPISLFVRFQHPTRGVPYILLIMCVRRRDVLQVMQGWRVYPDEVDVADARKPLDILRALTDAYGDDLTVGSKRGKFFLYERVPVDPVRETTFISGLSPRFLASFFIRPSDNGTLLEVSMAFAIDLDKYTAALGRHGVWSGD